MGARMKPIPSKYGIKDIGVGLLDSITKGLYQDPFYVLREYLQNAVDAKPSEIEVTVSDVSVKISDNGTGMDRRGINKARRIGISEKPSDMLGFRGIGIWSGLAIADKIVMTTTKAGVDRKYILSIDAAGIKKELLSRKPLAEVLNIYVKIWETPEEALAHYTQVELSGIPEEPMQTLLDDEKMKAFIGQTLPVDFDPRFKYRETIANTLGRNVDNYYVARISFNGEPVYKPFINEVEHPMFYPLSKDGEHYGYCWACIHEKRGKIKDDSVASLVYKLKGMTVGHRRTTRTLFKPGSEHLIEWVTGEIYITHPEIIPNAARDFFEYSPAREKFLEVTRYELEKIEKEIRRKSKKEVAHDKVVNSIKQAEEIMADLPKLSVWDKIRAVQDLQKLEQVLGRKKKDVGLRKTKERAEETIQKIVVATEEIPVPKVKKIEKRIEIDEVLSSDQLNQQSKEILGMVLEVLSTGLGKGDLYNSIVNEIAEKIKDQIIVGAKH